MCRPTVCKTCGKTTWAGCGMHVAQVKATVAPESWCDGHVARPGESKGKGLLGRLGLGR